jgi:KAP family P-loop domain
MWSDNETSIDLLGFDYLVDSLEIVLTEPRLLPVTVGVLGDWGSGKTSLLRMAAERLGKSGDYVIVFFSPWRYEAYEDVKAALMDAVLTKVEERIPKDDNDKLGVLRKLRRKVTRMMAGPAAAARVMLPAATTAAAAHEGLPPELAAAAGAAAMAAADAVEAQIKGEQTSQPATPSVFESVADFREEFEGLVTSLADKVKGVIIFIDDLDRCLDPTVIDVFEAIRLFLQVASTAFVIAANREIVQAAVERRYPAGKEGDPALGKDYLEKIIQVEVNIPPLAEAEAETYLNLLFADLRLEPAQMVKVREAAADRRQQGQFAVAMNYGIAKGVLGTVSAELQADFTIANRIAPTLSRGLRGNPRQLKRFLNTLLLRLQTAKRRGVELDPAILAKLMILEQVERNFQRLFLWQLTQHGIPNELAVAEDAADKRLDNLGDSVPADLREWYGSPTVRSWLDLQPHLAGLPLGQYFFFSRDRLSPAAPEARLSANLQALLSRLQAPTQAQRRVAIEEAAKLQTEEFAPLYEAMLELASRRPDTPALTTVVDLTEKVPSAWPALAGMLSKIPPKDVPITLPVRLATLGPTQVEVRGLFDQWESSGPTALKKAVAEAKKGLR